MEKLRAAEKTAKEKRACLYANAPAPTAKSNGTAINGNVRQFDGTVVRIWSGDQISVNDRETGKERRLQLSSTRGPKSVLRVSHNVGVTKNNRNRLSDPKQAYYAQEAREFLRKRLIGKQVKVHVDFVRPREGEYEERECATVRYGNQNTCVLGRRGRKIDVN